MVIGVLALQGDFDAHRRRLKELGAKVVLVKKPEQLDQIDGLIIPGGESGTFLKLLGEAGFEKLKQFVKAKPTFGTCAGAILLASEIENPQQAGLGALDIRIRRNAYGRQIDSSIREGKFVEDFEIQYARDLVAQAKGWHRSEVLASSKPFFQKKEQEEKTRIADARSVQGLSALAWRRGCSASRLRQPGAVEVRDRARDHAPTRRTGRAFLRPCPRSRRHAPGVA